MSSAPKLLTPTDYWNLEKDSELRHEFYQGEVFAMTGGSPRHALIAANFIGFIRGQLESGPCVVYTGDLRIKVEASGLHTYPDASIVCGDLELDETVPHTVLNPTVLVEVLSDSTEKYDRGTKSANYRKVDSLQELILVSQDQPLVERYARTDSGWLLTEAAGLDCSLDLDSVQASLPLAEFYRSVNFESPRE
jgi:Uma2 family endonuclease